MLSHAKKAVDTYTQRLGIDAESFVVEIASNDGYLLKNFVEAGVRCLGVEPAENIAVVARENGIDSWVDFFGEDLGRKIGEEKGKADLIIGNNVFAHVPDTIGFVAGISELLSENGTACLEFPYGKELFERNEFDTIYHEHVFYFTVTPLVPLLARHGLEIYDVEALPIHGGSLRVWIGHEGHHEVEDAVGEVLTAEEAEGLKSMEYYETFGDRVRGVRDELNRLISEAVSDGKTVAAYGASAKGSTLLNYCDPSEESIDFIVDRSDIKQGLFSPGLHLPILPPEELEKAMPDFTLLLTWNFADEILEQQSSYRDAGGKFIVPIPEVTVC
ncbi:MAG: class I SAM-dependent methyltransferase [Verrucomicrobiota bacterium]